MKLFILSKDSILMRLRVFHFVPPYTCSVFLNLKLCNILGSLVRLLGLGLGIGLGKGLGLRLGLGLE
jgi:hypothetical protein